MTSIVTDHNITALDESATAVWSPDRVYRYGLTRCWDDQRPMACFVMLNPSTADAFRLDPTVRRCVGFARAWDAGGLLVLNLFGLRSTSPRALYSHDDPVGPDNDTIITQCLDGWWGALWPVVAAWGFHGRLFGRDTEVLGLIRGRHTPMALGLTVDGTPRHPLYVNGSTTPTPYGDPGSPIHQLIIDDI